MREHYITGCQLDLWDDKRKPSPRADLPRTGPYIIYDESSTPSADDPASHSCFAGQVRLRSPKLRRTGYLIDADHRSTLLFDPEALEGRLSTVYPIDFSRRSPTWWGVLWGRSP